MFLVELKSGQQEVYHSLDDFTAAIRRGEVSAQSRIYHRAASRWIPVTLHPHFRKIVAERSVEPLPPLPRAQWTFLPPEPVEEARHHGAGEEPPDGDVTATKATAARSWRSMLSGLIRQHRG